MAVNIVYIQYVSLRIERDIAHAKVSVTSFE